jgi:hypothetical protein
MLNATAKIEDVRRVFPRTIERCGTPVATPHSLSVQILGGFSKPTMAQSQKKREAVKDFLAVAFPGQRLGIVGHKSSVQTFADLPNTTTTWHGANAGDDSMRDVDVGVVFDGPRAPAAAIAALAAARTGRLVKEAAPVMGTETVLMTDGTGVSVPVLQYENPHAQAVHQSIHHAAVAQASARPRQLLRTETNPSILLLFGNVASDKPVDLIIRWADVRPDRLTSMVRRGRVCINAVDMHLWHPDLFKTAKAGSSARERFGDVTARLMTMLDRDARPWSSVQFQPAGQGQHLRSIMCPSGEVLQLRAEAEAKHGALVHWSVRSIWNGRKKVIPISAEIDFLTATGMTSRPVPAVGTGHLPPPPDHSKTTEVGLISRIGT